VNRLRSHSQPPCSAMFLLVPLDTLMLVVGFLPIADVLRLGWTCHLAFVLTGWWQEERSRKTTLLRRVLSDLRPRCAAIIGKATRTDLVWILRERTVPPRV
jgi:hypothetical protein